MRQLRLVGLSFFITAGLNAAQLPGWLKVEKASMSSWSLTLDVAGDPVFSQKTGKGPVKQVLVLFPKKSSAYNTSLSRILRVFREKRQRAVVTVHNYGGKEARGLPLLPGLKRRFDLVFAMGSKSTAFLHKHYTSGAVPVVSVCAKDPVIMGQMEDYKKGSGRNFAYTSLNVPVALQLNYLKRFMPQLKVLAVLVARKNVSAWKTQAKPLIALARKRGIRVLSVVVENQKAAQAELAVKVPAAVFRMRLLDPDLRNSLFWITGSTSVFREIKTINAGAGKVPVLSTVPNVVKAGKDSALLSIGVGFENNAALAALYGVLILRGRKAGSLPVGLVSPPDIAVNFFRAKLIGIRIPFSFLETASFVYDYQGRLARARGLLVKSKSEQNDKEVK